MDLLGVIVWVLIAAVVYWLCVMLGLPWIVAIIAAIVVLLAAPNIRT